MSLPVAFSFLRECESLIGCPTVAKSEEVWIAYSRGSTWVWLLSASVITGLDKNTAQQILQVWEKSGAQSPDQLRNLLIKRSVQSAGAVLVQTVLDAGKDAPF